MRPSKLPWDELLVLVFLVLSFGAAAVSPVQGGPLRVFLPVGSPALGWTEDGAPQEFEGEDLYAYIDGGAEIYQEYGFRRVIVQDYKNSRGKSISLEIFEMETPSAAYGMFSLKRSGTGQTVDLGRAAELEAYYLNFWKGRFLVTLTGFDESKDTVDGVMAVGRSVDSKLPGGGEEPGLVKALPAGGMRPTSVKYLKGLLGLNNVYSFHTARGLSFAEGVKADYETGTTLILLAYGSAEDRARAESDLRASLEESGRFEPAAGAPAGLSLFQDQKARSVGLAGSGPRLAVAIGADKARVLDILGRVR